MELKANIQFQLAAPRHGTLWPLRCERRDCERRVGALAPPRMRLPRCVSGLCLHCERIPLRAGSWSVFFARRRLVQQSTMPL